MSHTTVKVSAQQCTLKGNRVSSLKKKLRISTAAATTTTFVLYLTSQDKNFLQTDTVPVDQPTRSKHRKSLRGRDKTIQQK